MKHLQSTIEGTWVEIKQVEITEAQKTLLSSRNESDKEAKKSLTLELKEARESEAIATDVTKANAKYNEVKPTLNDTDVYQLIAIDMVDNAGILNYRINGEHLQVRF